MPQSPRLPEVIEAEVLPKDPPQPAPEPAPAPPENAFAALFGGLSSIAKAVSPLIPSAGRVAVAAEASREVAVKVGEVVQNPEMRAGARKVRDAASAIGEQVSKVVTTRPLPGHR